MISLLPSSCDHFSVNATAACIHHGLAPTLASRLRPDEQSLQPPSHLFIVSDETASEPVRELNERLPSGSDVFTLGNVLSSARWTLKSDRRRPLTTCDASERQKKLTPKNPFFRNYPASVKLHRSRKLGLPDEIPPTWSCVRPCQQDYEVFFRPHTCTAAATAAMTQADRDPDVVQNCEICRHASNMAAMPTTASQKPTQVYQDDTERF